MRKSSPSASSIISLLLTTGPEAWNKRVRVGERLEGLPPSQCLLQGGIHLPSSHPIFSSLSLSEFVIISTFVCSFFFISPSSPSFILTVVVLIGLVHSFFLQNLQLGSFSTPPSSPSVYSNVNLQRLSRLLINSESEILSSFFFSSSQKEQRGNHLPLSLVHSEWTSWVAEALLGYEDPVTFLPPSPLSFLPSSFTLFHSLPLSLFSLPQIGPSRLSESLRWVA